MSDPTREMRKNPREKSHYHKTLSAGGTTAIVENKTSDFGIDYEKGCQIFTDFDKCTLYNVYCTMHM